MKDTKYGVTSTGFNAKSFDDIKLSLQEKIVEAFGTIRVNEDSNVGQLISTFTEPTAEEWLALQGVYNSMNPNTATDFSLDNIVSYIGLKRLEATATTFLAELRGVNQTIIPAGSEIIIPSINEVFKLDSQVVLSNTACVRIDLDLDFVVGGVYNIIINNRLFSYTAQPLNVKATVLDALALAIDNAQIGVTANNVVGDYLEIQENNLNLINVTFSSNIRIDDVYKLAQFTAVNKGDIAVAVDEEIEIQTPISGWTEVSDNQPSITGRNIETDDELRIRRSSSLKLAGAGTIDAIRARILNVTGVTAATITENITNTTVGNLPPHSFESLVLGGDNQLIANAIWATKPAGIASIGNVANNIIDASGKIQVVYFSRPVKLYIFVSIVLTKDDNLYPTNGNDVIKQSIAKQINELQVGQTVVYQSLYQSVYKVPGVTSAVIRIGSSLVENPIVPPTLSSENIVPAASQIAVTDLTKITIA